MTPKPSKERLIEALQSFTEEVNGVPTVRGMRQDGPFTPHYYKEEFGSWHNALRAANIQPTHGINPDVSREELIRALQEVNEAAGQSPRQREVEELGEYSYILYIEEFESYIHALKEAGIEPDEKQYRFSNVETPEEKRGSENIEKLRRDGPTPVTELPQGMSTKDRQNGMWKFSINSGATRSADSIYYLDGEHKPELVIRRFLRENPHVLEYRDPHGIKIEIGDHKSSWKEVGQEVVDELVERGGPRHADFNNLVVIRTDQDSKLQYCFERSIRNQVDTDLLSIDIKGSDENQPIWGFSDGDLWKILSKRDGLLFSTEPGVFTHYVSIGQTIEDRNVMTKLWIEYEDGVRSGGIDEPWPYLALGTDVQEIQLREETVSEKLGIELSDTPVQLFDEEDLSEFLNSYGGFGSFLREQERRASQVASGGNQEFEAEPHTIEALLDLPWDDLPLEKDPTLEETRRKKRKNAFQKGIYQIYSGCAVCGRLTESPSGNADLEAAHIVPKSADGPDVLQNGIGLCSRHHWAFDNGWFEFDENYQIEVKGTPDLKGYEEFEQYDGIRLQVPSEMRLRPHPQYIRQRFGTK